MSIRVKYIHFPDWAKVIEGLKNQKEKDPIIVSDEVEARTFLKTANSTINPFYYFIVFIKSTKEIYTHGEFYNCSDTGSSDIDQILEGIQGKIEVLEDSKVDSEDFSNLVSEVEENEEVTAKALTELNNVKASKVDVDELINQIKDLINLKEDRLSCDDFKTINGECILGEGEINIVEPDHFRTNPTVQQGTIQNVSVNEYGHVTSITARSLTSTDIPDLDASKISSGTISIDRLPAGALERLYTVATESAAMSLTIQEGDVVRVTGNDNKMYFCVSDSATTFASKFTEFTAGSATSVPWSGITDKPVGIDGWGDRIGVIEGTLPDYLPKSGGILSGDISTRSFASGTDNLGVFIQGKGKNGIRFQYYKSEVSYDMLLLSDGKMLWNEQPVIHSGNYSDYALPITGGTVNGSITATKFIGSIEEEVVDDLNNATAGRIFTMTSGYGSMDGNKPVYGWVAGLTLQLARNGAFRHQLAFSDDLYFRKEENASWDAWRKILDNSNYSDYALPITGGTVNGNVTATKFIGNLQGNADSATKAGDSTFVIYPESCNEINFGGSNTDVSIYFGYRSKDGRPTPTRYIFGRDGSAELKAKTFIGDLQGNAATATKATQDGSGNVITSTYATNAYSTINIGSTAIASNSKTGTFTIVAGSNITLTPDATNKKVTIAATNTTYNIATTSANGLMSASDKSKLDGIEAGALKTRVKGNAESNYRTGDVNITAANLGITVINNTKDADKNVKSATTASTCTGNAETATKLQTSRSIWGQSFDGSGNITGNFTTTGNITASGTLTLNGTTISYDKTKNAFVLPANLVVQGDVACTSTLSSFDPNTITESVMIDGSTIKRNSNGTLYVNSSALGTIPTKLSQLTDDVVSGHYLPTSGGTINGNLVTLGTINANGITVNGTVRATSFISDIFRNMPLSEFNAASVSIDPNKYYRLTAAKSSLTITLNTPADNTILNEYFIEFPCGGSVSLPSGLIWANGKAPEFESGATYQISIVNNLAIFTKFVS